MSSPNPSGVNLAADMAALVESLNARLDQLDQELTRAQADAAMGGLAFAIAHEMNNLLTPVVAYARMALDDPDDAALTRKALERAAEQADQAARISQSILALGLGGRGEGAAGVSVVGEEFARAVGCLGEGPAKRGIMIERGGGMRSEVAMSPADLQQVFVNLLLNAIKAIDRSGSIRISACSTWNTAGRELVELAISDDGCGVPEAIRDRVFVAGISGSGGTGYGLAVCKRLLESVGGSISLEPRSGRGTTVRLSIPAASAVVLDDPNTIQTHQNVA